MSILKLFLTFSVFQFTGKKNIFWLFNTNLYILFLFFFFILVCFQWVKEENKAILDDSLSKLENVTPEFCKNECYLIPDCMLNLFRIKKKKNYFF